MSDRVTMLRKPMLEEWSSKGRVPDPRIRKQSSILDQGHLSAH